MAASTKTGYDPSTIQWVDIEVAETREDPIPGEDEYVQIMVRQLQEKLAKMKPRGSTAAAQPQARKTGSTPAACVESPRLLATWKPTHTPRIRSEELVIVLKPKITMDLHAAFGPGGIGTAVQRFTGSTTNAGVRVARDRTSFEARNIVGCFPLLSLRKDSVTGGTNTHAVAKWARIKFTPHKRRQGMRANEITGDNPP
ncbi:hypothetical protein MRX96_026438 [Rhipicephalus microplus]